MTIFQDKLMKRTFCDEAGDYAVPNVLSPRDLVFRPDISYINWTIIIITYKFYEDLIKTLHAITVTR